MESGRALRGVSVDPLKRFCRTFWGVSYLLRGVLLCKFSLYLAVRARIGVRALRLQPHQPHG